MGWILEKKEDNHGLVLTFINDESDSGIQSFSLKQDEHKSIVLTILCTDDGKAKITEYLGRESLIRSFLNSADSSKKYIIKDSFIATYIILAISESAYIALEDRELIQHNFSLSNLFVNEDRPGRVAVALAMEKGFEVGYQYARKQLQRTNGESPCMDRLAKHSITFAEKISARKLHRYGEHSLLWQAAKKIPKSSNSQNLPADIDEIISIAKNFN